MKTHFSSIEPLESRIAPATITASFTDANNDLVKFTATGPLPALATVDLASHISVFALTPDGKHNTYDVNLTDPAFNGASFTASAKKAGGGDGQLSVGYIDADGNVLGNVTVAGDLGQITVGFIPGVGGIDATPITVLKTLNVQSLGRFDAFGRSNGESLNVSNIQGTLNSLVVSGDVANADLEVTYGVLNSASIGGSLIGNGGGNGGHIFADSIAKISVKGDLRGGDGDYSGSIGSGEGIGSVSVGGSVIGGDGVNSGDIYTSTAFEVSKIGSVSIGGSLVGGSGELSGVIGGKASGGGTHPISLGTVTIGHDIVGGHGLQSGEVWSFGGTLDHLTVKGSLIGGTNTKSGAVIVDTTPAIDITTIAISGSVYGGDGTSSGYIEPVHGARSVSIGGSLIGGAGNSSAEIYGDDGLGMVTIAHDIRGGSGPYSGAVGSSLSVTGVSVGGSVYGGGGVNSGDIFGALNGESKIGKVSIAGSLFGGDGNYSGVIGGEPSVGETLYLSLGTITIGHDIVGGYGDNSAEVWADNGTLDSLTVKGSVYGGYGASSAEIEVDHHAGVSTISIAGNVYGGHGTSSGDMDFGSGLNTVTVGGSLIGGLGTNSAAIIAEGGALGFAKIGHDVRGGDGSYSAAIYGLISGYSVGGNIIPGVGTNSAFVI